MEVLNHPSLHRCPHVSSIFSRVCVLHVKTRSSILAGNGLSLLLSICTVSCCFVSPIYPCSSQQRFTSGPPLVVKQFGLWCHPVSTPYEDVCKAFTQRGYKQLQKAALGTNQAENPLTSGVRCGMLTWYGNGWCLRWGGLVGRHSPQSRGSQPYNTMTREQSQSSDP